MWERFRRWVTIEYYWRKRQRQRNNIRTGSPNRRQRSMVLPIAVVVLAGVGLAILLSRIIASIYRSFIPFVSGPQIADAYWASIASALKLSLVFVGIIAVCLVLLFMKLIKRDNKNTRK